MLWAYESNGALYSATCPNYYCELVEKAGGDIIDLTNLETASVTGRGSITDFTAFYEVAATSDVWIYAGSNWGSTTMSAAVLVRLAQ